MIYGEVPYQRGYLRSIVHKPLGSNRLPAIFYIQGHGCGSVHFAEDSLAPVKQLVDGWVSAGYVVFRIEKPGVGESAGTKECVRLSYEEEKAAFQNAFAAFKKLSFVDSTRYFLFGHSLGGALAPLLVAQSGSKPRGIITYGTVVKPWFEHMIDVYRQKPLLYQESYQSIEANTRMMIPLLYEWLVQAKTPTELLQEPDFEAILTSKENPLAYHRGTFLGAHLGILPNFSSKISRRHGRRQQCLLWPCTESLIVKLSAQNRRRALPALSMKYVLSWERISN